MNLACLQNNGNEEIRHDLRAQDAIVGHVVIADSAAVTGPAPLEAAPADKSSNLRLPNIPGTLPPDFLDAQTFDAGLPVCLVSRCQDQVCSLGLNNPRPHRAFVFYFASETAPAV